MRHFEKNDYLWFVRIIVNFADIEKEGEGGGGGEIKFS
jgi:hypothetical protein